MSGVYAAPTPPHSWIRGLFQHLKCTNLCISFDQAIEVIDLDPELTFKRFLEGA